MVGIYHDFFLTYLKDHLKYVKVTSKNIICPCPWCEYGKEKKHYHLYISLELPIWRCFQARCEQSGFLSKLLNKISGTNKVEDFVDKSFVKESSEKKLDVSAKKKKPLVLPKINTDQFKLKTMYMRYRLDSRVDVHSIPNLVFDIREFVAVNNLNLDDKTKGMLEFLHSNFVGFLSHHNTLLVLRNIDPDASFRYYKLHICDQEFLDYYKIDGASYNSNKIVVSEGPFDILVEHMKDSLKIKDTVASYFASFSGSFQSLVKSIAFHEQIFRQHLVILSHSDVGIDVYRKLKKSSSHLIDKLDVYYNDCGKDFADVKVSPFRVQI